MCIYYAIISFYSYFPQSMYALAGYVMIFTATECVMFAFGFMRLGKFAGIKITAGEIFIPTLCSVGAFSFTRVAIVCIIRQPVCTLVLAITLGATLYAELVFVINRYWRACGFFRRSSEKVGRRLKFEHIHIPVVTIFLSGIGQ